MKNKKLAIELIIVPVCFSYLILNYLNNKILALVLFTFTSLILSIWFVPKYIDEIYVYESRKNPLKIVLIISNILLLVLSIINFIYKTKLVKVLLILVTIIVSLFLIKLFVKNIKELIRKDKDFSINILHGFFCFLFLLTLISTLIIYIK